MQPLKTPASWLHYFRDIGLGEDVAQQHREYVAKLLGNSVPVVFDWHHLSALLGVSINFTVSVVNSSSSHYREFRLPKRSGGHRTIVAPRRALKLCQRWILDNILSGVKINSAAKGFVPRRSIKSHCSPHIGAPCLLKVDFKDFFPSITKARVISIFRSLGYSDKVSLYLASFCCHGNYLPQGGVTSPAISNLVCRRLDTRLDAFARSRGWTYSRYADDLVISGSDLNHSVVSLVELIAEEEGFRLNSLKTRIYRGEARPIVTGLVLGDTKLAVPRSFKREISKQVYYVSRYGVLSHSAKTRSRNPFLISTLLGKIGFWLYIEPDCQRARAMRDKLLTMTDAI